ncbi:hypothetical protein AJ79_00015 [Helicocarpus griseus UAMH5409]|uniref:AB hydrolase-1 domain-containing protein n=1 Tax=Helicocarpus griseus UAMH5409 TaxID=1447875 RepID=A0A2B7YDM9_9EURO|nr:hypothetical protein AJ79_00015 [Helicocarpus griseus UAMH5409]
MEPTNTDWEHGEHEGLVKIANHCLFLSVYGPDRLPGEPIVIIIPNVATSIKQWSAVRKVLQPTIRTLLYDRSGLGDSEEMPNPTAPTAENLALELDVLLAEAKIKPPFVIVCHSYGGIIAREFLAIKRFKGETRHIVGMVFVEGDQEKTTELRPDDNLRALSEGQDLLEVTGLRNDMVLSEEERQSISKEAETEKYQETAEAEASQVIDSYRELGEKKQLDEEPPILESFPVSVLKGNIVRDHERIHAGAVREGKGTFEQHLGGLRKIALYREIDEILQKENLNLSTTSSFSVAERSGHNIHLTEPEAILKEAQWVLKNIRGG